MLKKTKEYLINIILTIIKAYQSIASPAIGDRCRFYPTCSSYSAQAFAKYGLMRGAHKSLTRLIKCHPFHPGGIDEI